jgi:DNA-binding XRE family transcriptional regulator
MKENDYGVIKLSEETGIAKQTIRRLLRGNSTGNLHTWGVIANKLNVSIDWIYHNGE